MTKLFPVLVLMCLLTGCASNSITNLTPTSQPRNTTGRYFVEMQFDSQQQTLRQQSLAPMVVVGFQTYPMRQTLKMTNRWEALVPVPADRNSIVYYFKVSYEYNKFGSQPGQASKLSPEYKLSITEK